MECIAVTGLAVFTFGLFTIGAKNPFVTLARKIIFTFLTIICIVSFMTGLFIYLTTIGQIFNLFENEIPSILVFAILEGIAITAGLLTCLVQD